MKKSILILALALVGINAFGANHNMTLTNLVGNTNISGQYMDLNGNTSIVDQYHDGDMVLLYQQQKAAAMLYSSVDHQVEWTKDNMGGIFQVTAAGLLNSNNSDKPVNGNTGFFTSLDNLMGNHVWTRYMLPVYVNDSANVVFGYQARWDSFNGDVQFNPNNMLTAYRLSDGTKLWQDTISHYTRWGWNNVMYLPENGDYLVWTDELMLIDPQEGIVKRMTVNTGRYGVPVGVSKKDIRTDHGTDADYAFTPYVDRGYYTGIKSNVIFNDGKIYLADGEDLYCLDEDLNVMWFAQLPLKETSAMHIQLNGDRITLLASGLAYLEGCSYNISNPFVAEYNVENGKQLYLNNIKVDGKVMDAYLGNEKAFFLTSNGLDVVSNFEQPQIRNYDKSVIGKTSQIGNKPMYYLENNHLSAMGTEGNKILLVGKDGIDREFDGDSETLAGSAQKNSLYDHRGNDIYTRMARDNKGRVTDDPGDLVVASNDGDVKAHFTTNFNGAFYDDGKLTIIMKDGIFTANM